MQKNPLFSSLVISAAVQKVVWIVTKRVKNSPKDYLNIFFLIANSFRVSQSPNPEIHLQQMPGKKKKKKRGTGSFLGTHKGDKPLKFLSKSIYYISLLLNQKHRESKEKYFYPLNNLN